MKAPRSQSGFTIVEILIVVVVIGILAAIVIVAYGGITARANDTKRSADLSSVQKALELYYIDKGGYPMCGATGANIPPAFSSGTLTACLADDLIPAYLGALPDDPKNSGSYVYRYAAGYKKLSSSSFDATTPTDNYILGTKQDGVSSPIYGGWGFSDLTLLLGSSH